MVEKKAAYEVPGQSRGQRGLLSSQSCAGSCRQRRKEVYQGVTAVGLAELDKNGSSSGSVAISGSGLGVNVDDI